MKEIHIYDFDATLFRSPRAPAWYDNDRDGEWHQNPFSFAEPCLPSGEQWVKPVLADAKRSIASKDVYAVVCTGRRKHFQKVVEGLLRKKGLRFDEVILKDQGGTEAFKKRVIDDLMSDFPNAVVHIWEDRHHHLKSFMNHIEMNGGVGVPHAVPDNYSQAECTEEDFRSMRRSASEVIRNLEMRVARLEKQAKWPEFPDYIMKNDEVSGIWPDSKWQQSLKVMHDLLGKSGFRFYEEKDYQVHYLHKGVVKPGQFKFEIRIEDLVEGDSLARVKSFIRLKDKVVSWVEMWLPTREKRHTYEYPLEYLEKNLKKILGNKKGKRFAIDFAMDLLKHEGIYVS